MAGLKVRAYAGGEVKYAGYYGLQRRKPGEEFMIDKQEDFAPLWMEAVGWTPRDMTSTEKFAQKEIIKPSSGAMVSAKKKGIDKAKAGEPVALSQMGAKSVVTPENPVPVEVKEVNTEDNSHNASEEVI